MKSVSDGMAAWPDIASYRNSNHYITRISEIMYERARAAAWEARARLAIDNLHHDYECAQHQLQARYAGGKRLVAAPCDCGLEELLAAIGPLPELPPNSAGG